MKNLHNIGTDIPDEIKTYIARYYNYSKNKHPEPRVKKVGDKYYIKTRNPNWFDWPLISMQTWQSRPDITFKDFRREMVMIGE